MITILHLYPNHLNTYGDTGNILALKKRLAWRGIDYTVIEHNPDDVFDYTPDIIFGGGGQDSNQSLIEDDFKKNADKIKQLIEDGTPTLAICGSYQMLGKYFQTKQGKKIEGTGALALHTEAGDKRLIGNIVIETERFGTVVGYENHSGQTYIENLKPFGKVTKGYGNTETSAYEGVFYKNTIGTYLHGPILPKNPKVTDFLIETALKRQGVTAPLKALDDTVEDAARAQAKLREN